MSGARSIRTARHELTFLPGSEALYDSVFADLDAAGRHILIESYIVSSDAMGRELYAALHRARQRGVSVRLLYDPLGSEKTDPSFFDDLRASGVDVRSYGTFPGFPRPYLDARDHGRVLVIDDAAYTGGAAWGDQWLPRQRGGRGWHDMCCRVTGPVVEDFAALFAQRFAEGAGERAPADFDTGSRYPDLRLVSDTPDRSSSLVYEEHIRAMGQARARLWLVNAYFYPPADMLTVMAEAAARGVDVRIVVPGEDNDLPLFRRAARAEYREWLAAGFAHYEYAGKMIHSKYAVIDDGWASIGTFNANPVSVGLSNEVNLFLRDPRAVAALAEQVEDDTAHSDEVRPEDLAHRPVLQRAADQLAAAALSAADHLFGPR